MRKRVVTLITALAMILTAVIPGTTPQAAEINAKATGTTYYVSTIHGKDSNNGTSQNTPFYSLQKINHLDLQPGDKILLECGSVFTNGYLHLFEQSGSAEAPIVIDQYGTGEAPVIDTNGQGVWFQNYGQRLDNTWHQYQGYVSSSILLYDSEYIEIQNLEIVNEAPQIDTVYNATDMMNRTGVAAVAQDAGTIDHIHLKNLNIHDVIGNVYNKHMNNGGIYFTVYLPHDAQMGTPSENQAEFISSQTGISRFNDVLIDGCSVVNTNRWGIAVGFTALWNKYTNMEISDEDIAKYGSTNVVIRNNYVKDAGGDSITLMYCDKPLVEYNVSDGAARQMHSGDYGPQGETQRFAAGIWPWKCKDAIFQYNEAFDTKNVNNENGDGQAWDADWSDGTIYQYNYSHHNEGGCLMVCQSQAYRTTFRYNISQNDMRSVLDPCGNPKAHIYNNVFYVADGVPIYRERSNGEAVLENNIFYYSGETPKQENWTIGNKTYSNNLYYNYANVPTDKAAVKVNKGTQVFVDAGSAPDAVSSSCTVRKHEDPETASVFDGYRLSENSPAIGAGKVIEDANGYDSSAVDFFGNDLSDVTTFDIGAYQYQEGMGGQPQKPSKPSVPEIGETTDSTVEISWMADETGKVKGYILKNGNDVLMDLSGEELEAATDGQKITITLEELEAGTDYTLTLAAYNENNVESEPRTITFTTADEGQTGGDRPEKPSKPEIGKITESTVELSWAAADSAEKIKGYKIKNGEDVIKDLTGEELKTATAGQKITITLEGLKAGTDYTLKLIAYNEQGAESASQTITFKTEESQTGGQNQKPQKPALPAVNGIAQTEATVSWTASADTDNVIGYRIRNGNTQLLDLTGAGLTAATNTTTKKVTAKLKNLKAGTKYALSLTAYNQNGESEPQTFTFTTKSAATTTKPVPKPVPKPASIKLSQTSLVLYTKKETSSILKATVSNLTGAVKWTSSNPSVATVSGGTVKAIKAGTAVITAAVGNYKAACTVTVKKPSIKVKKSFTVRKGKKVKMKVTVVPTGKITYKSSKKKIATVNKRGVIKGVKKGSCKITIKCNGVKKVVKIKVK